MPLAFLKLPPELVRAIMSHLSLDDILALKLSCKRLSYLVHEPQLEHYRIRIQEAGLRDRSPPGGLSIRERVTALSRWESAWENISVSAADPFSDPVARHHHYHHYHHRHHVVEIEESDPDRQVMVVEDFYIELCADGRAQDYRYTYLDLRSSLKQEDVHSVCLKFPQTVGLLCHAFAIDKYNMFAMLIEAPWLCNCMELRLFNFQDGTPHPFSTRPLLVEGERTFCIAKMYIIDDHVLIVTTLDFPGKPESCLIAVGWKDRSVARICLPTSHFFNDIIVLSSDTLALVNPVDNTLEICRLDIPAAKLHAQHKLELPLIRNDTSLFRADITTTSSSSCSSSGTAIIARPSSSTIPFYPDPARGIICLALQYGAKHTGYHFDDLGGVWVHDDVDDDYDVNVTEERSYQLLVVRLSAFTTTTTKDAALPADVPPPGCTKIPWRDWSPISARLLPHIELGGSGAQAVALLHEGLFIFVGTASTGTANATVVTHLDFNPFHFRRCGTSGIEARLRGVGVDDDDEEEEEDEEDEEEGRKEGEDEGEEEGLGLPYRQMSIIWPEDSETYFNTERIVRVMTRNSATSALTEFEGDVGSTVCRRVIVYPMTG